MANIKVTSQNRIQQGWEDIFCGLERAEPECAAGVMSRRSARSDDDLFCMHALDALTTMESRVACMVVVGVAAAINQGFGHRDELVLFVSDTMCILPSTVEYHLNELRGTDPSRHRWVVSEDGYYKLLNDIVPIELP